jgi:hypothetical protein
LLETTDYCSTSNEHELEQMCPFAKALHPSFSASGVPYPISNDEHLRQCDILSNALALSTDRTMLEPLPVVSIACCRATKEYFEEATQSIALQSLCNMEECYNEFVMAFPEVDLEAECADVDPVFECKFDLRAGPATIPINLGFVTEACCEAVQGHASGSGSLDDICQDRGCVKAYENLFQQGQSFANPGSTDSLEDVCLNMPPSSGADEESGGSDEENIMPDEETVPTTSPDIQAEEAMEEAIEEESASAGTRLLPLLQPVLGMLSIVILYSSLYS